MVQPIVKLSSARHPPTRRPEAASHGRAPPPRRCDRPRARCPARGAARPADGFLSAALLAELDADAERRAVRLVIALVPYFGTVQPELLSPTIRRPPGEFDLGLPNRRYAEIARANDIPLLDLTADFVEFHAGDAQRRDLFFPEDEHWTVLGNCLAAVLIANWLDPSTAATVDGCRP